MVVRGIILQRTRQQPEQGEDKPSPLLWTIWLAKRLRSPWLGDKYISCGRLVAGIKQHWILSFTRQQSPIGASLAIPVPRQDAIFRLSFLWPEYASGEGIIYAATCVFGGGSGSLSCIALFTSISSTSCPCWTASP